MTNYPIPDQLTPARIAACLTGQSARQVPTEPSPGLTPSAVLLPLLWQGEQWRLLLIKRSLAVANHRGQFAFPGGRWEPTDPDAPSCALRETAEELGIPPARVTLLGDLPPVATSNTGFLIHPCVGVIPSDTILTPDPREVESTLTIELAFFRDPANCQPDPAPDAIRFYCHYDYGSVKIWGATATIIRQFVALLPALG